MRVGLVYFSNRGFTGKILHIGGHNGHFDKRGMVNNLQEQKRSPGQMVGGWDITII